jgi:hypothetical protein
LQDVRDACNILECVNVLGIILVSRVSSKMAINGDILARNSYMFREEPREIRILSGTHAASIFYEFDESMARRGRKI